MLTSCRLMLACATLAMLVPALSHAQAPKQPIRGLISMGAYRFVGAGGEPVNTLAPMRRNAKSSADLGAVATNSRRTYRGRQRHRSNARQDSGLQ